VREDDALGSPVEPLEKIIVAMSSRDAGRSSQQISRWPSPQEARSQGGGDTFTEARVLGYVLDENRFARRLDLDLLQKNPRGDDRFQLHCLRTGGEGFIRNGVVQVYRTLPINIAAYYKRAGTKAAAGCRPFPGLALLSQAPREHQSPATPKQLSFGLCPSAMGKRGNASAPSR